MARKGEMHDEAVVMFKTCAVIFLEAGVKSNTFYRWLESFKTHKDMTKMHSFMGQLRPILERGMTVWTALAINRIGWAQLKTISRDSGHVQKMNAAITDFRTMWSKKPARRRHSE